MRKLLKCIEHISVIEVKLHVLMLGAQPDLKIKVSSEIHLISSLKN